MFHQKHCSQEKLIPSSLVSCETLIEALTILIFVPAKLGYKQELRRNFTMIEVFGIAFSIMGLLPSIASTLAFSIPAGPVGMVWGWFLASMFIFVVGVAMADLGSAMPTSGGLYWW
jgi:amino acid transporter